MSTQKIVLPTLRGIYYVFGVISFISFALFTTTIVIASFRLGQFPSFLHSPDPNSLGLTFISYTGIYLFFLSYLSFVPWLVLTSILFIFFRKKVQLSIVPMILASIAFIDYLIFELAFNDLFSWFMD